MMRKLVFTVELEFEDKISQDQEIGEVAINILEALKHECDAGNGLAPEVSETFTRKIVVSNSVVNTSVEHSFI